MTEIEFLVHLLLTEKVSEETKVKLLQRIETVEKERNKPIVTISQPFVSIPSQWQQITAPCAHEYEPYQYSVGDFPPRRCKKCQQLELAMVTVQNNTGGQVGGIVSMGGGPNGTVCGSNEIKTTSGASGAYFVN